MKSEIFFKLTIVILGGLKVQTKIYHSCNKFSFGKVVNSNTKHVFLGLVN